jgi:hypothetical protein
MGVSLPVLRGTDLAETRPDATLADVHSRAASAPVLQAGQARVFGSVLA